MGLEVDRKLLKRSHINPIFHFIFFHDMSKPSRAVFKRMGRKVIVMTKIIIISAKTKIVDVVAC